VSRRTLIRTGLLVLAASLLVSAVGWLSLEPGVEVPIHIGPDGVDRRVGRLEAAVSVPAVMVLVLVVGAIRAGRLRSSARPYEPVLIAMALVLMTLVHALVMSGSFGTREVTPAVLCVASAGVLVVVGVVRGSRPAGVGVATALIGLATALVVLSPVLDAPGVAVVVIVGTASTVVTSSVSKRLRRRSDGA
jgi:hypothetical protein